MRRLARAAALLIVVAGCAEAPSDDPLATFTGEPGGEEIFWARGELVLHDGCLALQIEEDEDLFTAMLPLPSDGGSDVGWEGRQLWFHQKAYDLGDELVFRATALETAAVPDAVREACEGSDLGHAVSPVDGTADLSIDPGPRVTGVGDQPRAFVAGIANGGMDALASGELAVVGDGCLGTCAGTDETVMRWPFGTTVAYQPVVRVTLPDGATVRLGERFEVGGGHTTETPSDSGDRDIRHVCGEEVGVFLVSPF